MSDDGHVWYVRIEEWSSDYMLEVECPWDPNDPNRPCILTLEDGTPDPDRPYTCAYADWTEAAWPSEYVVGSRRIRLEPQPTHRWDHGHLVVDLTETSDAEQR